MATGKEIYDLGTKHTGEKYILGAMAPKNNSNWKGPWDCAEFVSWCVYQVSGKLYGCEKNNGNPGSADAYTGYWGRDSRVLGKKISIEKAMKTKGAALLRLSVGGSVGHIVISDGKGGTVEAHSTKKGVIKSTAQGRRWDTGILIPWIEYETGSTPVEVEDPGIIYRLKKPMMRGPKVLAIQKALTNTGFSTNGTDGIFGHDTYAAVRAFQTSKGLLVDGEVGPQTLKALGL